MMNAVRGAHAVAVQMCVKVFLHETFTHKAQGLAIAP